MRIANRGRHWRRMAALSCAPILALAMTLVVVSSAHAGAYVVTQCEARWNPHADPKGYKPKANNQYSLHSNCGNPSGSPASALGVKVVSQAPAGNSGSHTWTAAEHTKIVSVFLSARLRREFGHKSRLRIGNSDFASGVDGSTTWKNYGWSGVGRDMFTAILECQRAPNCKDSSNARTHVRDVRLTIRDNTKPGVSAADSLLAGGWQRASRGLSVKGTDVGSGTRRVAASINGTQIGAKTAPCSLVGPSLATKMQPCGKDLSLSFPRLDTRSAPFINGDNTVRVCAWDLGTVEPANSFCRDYRVNVDNAVPTGWFELPPSSDPELIRASVSDAHSGVASGQISYRRVGSQRWLGLPTELRGGELRARVDSVAVPAGEYEFKFEVADMVGNTAESRHRSDGSPMRLKFPLKTASNLEARLPGGSEAQTVPYRQASKVAGRLTTPSGKPIAGAVLTVTERFDPGSLIDKRVRTVTTNADGRYGSKLPGGPSRRVSVGYSGSKRYQADDERGLDFNVKSKAQLKTSKRRVKAGRRVRFSGKIRRFFAAIPPGGKLIELQVKEGARTWGTVREALPTMATGRYKLHHRFKRFYVEPTTFKFRVKVTREQGWPYKAPVRSAARKVTVLPR